MISGINETVFQKAEEDTEAKAVVKDINKQADPVMVEIEVSNNDQEPHRLELS